MRRSTLFAGIAAVVLLSGGIAALVLWPEAQPEPEEPAPALTDKADLIVDSIDDVSSILFRPTDSTPYTLRRDPESGEIELDTAEAIFHGLPAMLSTVFNTAISLSNLTMVTGEADDGQLDLFGLNEPVMIWRIDRYDGTSVEHMVGGLQAAGQGRYVRCLNSREVFLLSERQSTMLTHRLEDLYDLSFFPFDRFPDADYVTQTIEYILLETEDYIIELKKRADEEQVELLLGQSAFQMLQPTIDECNDYVVMSSILENAASILPSSVEAVQPTDLSIYGLDNPGKLTLASGDWSRTLLIGDHDNERGGRYVIIEGYDAVLFDQSGDYSFLYVAPNQLRSRLIWLHNIIDISYLTFDLDGDIRVLKFEHDDEEQSLVAFLNDAEISERNARRLFIAALSITQNGETDIPIPDELPVYSILMRFREGGSDAVELYQINDSQFLIIHNGVSSGFFITRMSLQQNLLNSFDILDRGEDIP